MSVITTPSLNEVRTWFVDQSYVTIAFTTETGSRYTLVKRQAVTVLINDNNGSVSVGRIIQVIPARVPVQGASLRMSTRTGYVWTTGIVSFYVLEN